MLPRVVADDDRTRLLLLDHVVEVFQTVRSAQEWRDAHDRQGVRVHRHLGHAAGLGRPRQRHRRAATLEEAECLEGLTVLEQRVDDFPVGRLLADAFLGIRAPHHREPVDVREAELVVGHPVHHAVHRGGRPNAEPKRQSGDDNEGGMAAPEPQGVAHVRESDHNASCLDFLLSSRIPQSARLDTRRRYTAVRAASSSLRPPFFSRLSFFCGGGRSVTIMGGGRRGFWGAGTGATTGAPRPKDFSPSSP